MSWSMQSYDAEEKHCWSILQCEQSRVHAYLIVDLVRSMQYVLIEYVVCSTLVCDFEHTLTVLLAVELHCG